MALEIFQSNTLIIPMDVLYQNNGMFKAYGLVYKLLLNGIPVKWAIQPGKAFGGTDFVASAQDFQTSTPILNHNYTGGPFIIDSAFESAAAPIITAWQVLNPNVKVHRATAQFQANIAATMTSAPRIAIEENNNGIMRNYLNIAGIPDSNGNSWVSSSPDVLSEIDIANGAFFGYSLATCRNIGYDIFLSPHTGEGNWDLPALEFELNEYLRLGGYLHATCESVESLENTVGPFLTQTGFPGTDNNKGDDGSFVVDVPDFPVAQSVSTTQVQGLPGGSYESTYHLTPGLVYNSQTQIIAHFTEDGKQYDFMMVGPYKNGTGAGKVVYEGGHNYSPKLPYTSNMENLYYRFILDSIFFSISKSLMYLEFTPSVLIQNIINTITFSIINKGASTATNANFTVVLPAGMTYNNDATIAPTSVVGQTITWSSGALGNLASGVALTFTAGYIPVVAGSVKLADFSSSFGDNFDETYSFDQCITASVSSYTPPTLSAIKSVDRLFSSKDELLTYTVTIVNTSTIVATNVVFTDPTPNGTEFEPGSLSVSTAYTGTTIADGITLTTINPGQTVTITWKVEVMEIDDIPMFILNTGSVAIPNLPPQNTNTVSTQINHADIIPVKLVDKELSFVGETLTYTIGFTNTGNVSGTNLFFTDTTPTATTFIANSITIDGVTIPGATLELPSGGVTLPDLGVNQSTTLTFKVVITTVPSPDPNILNIGVVQYDHIVDPSSPNLDHEVKYSNIAHTFTYPPSDAFKIVNLDYATVGDTLTYIISWHNVSGLEQTNIVVVDTLPNDTTFVLNSVTVDGITIPDATVTPPNGINVGTLANDQRTTITFKVTVDTIPSPNPITNKATVIYSTTIPPGRNSQVTTEDYTNINYAKISDAVKKVDKDFATVGDTLTYTVSFMCSGNTSAVNVVFVDTVPRDTSIVLNSFIFNGINLGTQNPNPPNGVNLGTIATGTINTVTFKVKVDLIPFPNPVPNEATIRYDYLVDPIINLYNSDNTFSNVVNTQVNYIDLNPLEKYVDKSIATCGDIITYTISIPNAGNTAALNVIVHDTVPNGTSFIANSLTVNGTTIAGTPSSINVGTISSGTSSTISFKVIVDC
ncbi:hypothetical protein [Romboutsia sp.]|uniref:hypothetical protein n=1 Tax=Romboutsia sp. TaxID=1965302 RepID=UPI003F2B0359